MVRPISVDVGPNGADLAKDEGLQQHAPDEDIKHLILQSNEAHREFEAQYTSKNEQEEIPTLKNNCQLWIATE